MTTADAAIPNVFRDTAPVGNGAYRVRTGDCLQSIAWASGHHWKTIWSHAENAALRQARGDAMVLSPGDRLLVPPRRLKRLGAGTAARHRYCRRGVPAIVKIRVLRDGEPHAGAPWTLHVDGERRSGHTDADGRLQVAVPPAAQRGRLCVGDGEDALEYDLNLAHLAPFDTVLGVQQRLANLGLLGAAADGRWSETLRRAITAFRAERDLPVEGELSLASLEAIRDAHGA